MRVRRRGVLYTVLLAVPLIGAGLLAFGAWWSAEVLTRPVHVRTPAPPSLPLRPLTFSSQSGALLSAWFLQGSQGAGAVLLLHSVRASKVAMLPRARFLHASGFSVLLVDLQAHGESAGERITFGHREAADVGASIEQLRVLARGERVGVLGVSLGAAALLLSEARSMPDAIVLESVYPSIAAAVANRLRLRFGSLGPWLAPLFTVQLRPRLGVDASVLRPIDRAPTLERPVLLVHGAEDRHTTLAEAQQLFDRLPGPKALYAIPGAGHVDLHAFAGAAYEATVGDFLAHHLRAGG